MSSFFIKSVFIAETQLEKYLDRFISIFYTTYFSQHPKQLEEGLKGIGAQFLKFCIISSRKSTIDYPKVLHV